MWSASFQIVQFSAHTFSHGSRRRWLNSCLKETLISDSGRRKFRRLVRNAFPSFEDAISFESKMMTNPAEGIYESVCERKRGDSRAPYLSGAFHPRTRGATRGRSCEITSKDGLPPPCLRTRVVGITATAIFSSTEAGLLVAHHQATARSLRRRYVLSLVEGLGAPPFLYLQAKRVPAYLSGSKSSGYSWSPPQGRKLGGNRKTESPRLAVASEILYVSSRYDSSSNEAEVLVDHHRATARPLRRRYVLSLVEGLGASPLLCPQGRRVPANLSGSNSYPCTRGEEVER
ncbi:hypothetical protein AVEN_191259-1 [Araneus ventricosus]|uniref:Uncharacterized protein n=1 Tax=Araneus ventricosus TaxID=182803 RepID=A0A4Y2GCY7_ARAVE|nr:hypothetical protein AVEN_191259-1 [Araneus ventricosus]